MEPGRGHSGWGNRKKNNWQALKKIFVIKLCAHQMDNLFIKYVFTTFRDITTEILSNRPIGAFVVRQSQSRSDALALSVHIPYGMVAHYLIQKLIHNNKLYYKIQVCIYVNRLLNGNMKKIYNFYTKNPIDLIYLREYLFFRRIPKRCSKVSFPL